MLLDQRGTKKQLLIWRTVKIPKIFRNRSSVIMLVVIFKELVCGLVSSCLANEKGRKCLIWFVSGFLTDAIGLIFILLWPNCTELQKVEASMCHFCKAVLGKKEIS